MCVRFHPGVRLNFEASLLVWQREYHSFHWHALAQPYEEKQFCHYILQPSQKYFSHFLAYLLALSVRDNGLKTSSSPQYVHEYIQSWHVLVPYYHMCLFPVRFHLIISNYFLLHFFIFYLFPTFISIIYFFFFILF